jgi:hypothetical protein
MFPRTVTRKNQDGTEVSYYQIVESVWEPGAKYPHPKLVASLGRLTDENRAQLAKLAEKMMRQLAPERAALLDAAGEEDVGPNHPTRPFGAVYVLDELWYELGLGPLLRRLFGGARDPRALERATFAMVAYFATARGTKSKRACWRSWLAESAYVPGAHSLGLGRFYEAMDLFNAAHEDIERAVFEQVSSKVNAAVDLVFYYDTTSIHWEIEEEDEGRQWKRPPRDAEALRMRGKSKDDRPDAPQVVLAMAVTKDGYPVRSWIFPGNTTDVTTIEQVKRDLNAWKLHRCVLAGDRGMISEDNMATLMGGGGGYILGVPMRRGDKEVRDVVGRAGRYSVVANNLRVKELTYPSGEEGVRTRRYVMCYNPAEARRDKEQRDRLIAKLEGELEALEQRKPGDRRLRVHELMGNKTYRRFLVELKNDRLRINRGQIQTEAHLDGKYLITASDPTMSGEDLALAYKHLLTIERAWRTMKSELEVGPAHHYAPRRIRAHMRLCQLSLTLRRLVEVRSGMTWAEAQLVLDRLHAARVEPDVLGTTPIPMETKKLLSKVGVALPPRLVPFSGVRKVERRAKT